MVSWAWDGIHVYKGPELGLMLCCCYFEILNNLWTRNPAFSFCLVPHKLQSWTLIKWYRRNKRMEYFTTPKCLPSNPWQFFTVFHGASASSHQRCTLWRRAFRNSKWLLVIHNIGRTCLVIHSLHICLPSCVCMLSPFTYVLLFVTLWTITF